MILGLAAKFAIGLGLACTAFTIATIVLAVQKSNVETDLEKVQKELEELKKQIPSTTVSPAPPTSPSTETPPEPINYRLPRDVLPITYDLFLHPDLSTETFSGINKILINCTQDTSTIILHSNHLNISRVALNGKNITDFSFDEKREFLIINLAEELKKSNKYTLTINFGGIMKEKIVGLYSSTYTTEGGKEK